MSDLSADARELLNRARDELAPKPEDVAALRAAVAARIAVSGAAALGVSSAVKAATPPLGTAAGGLGLKVMASVLLLAAVGGGVGFTVASRTAGRRAGAPASPPLAPVRAPSAPVTTRVMPVPASTGTAPAPSPSPPVVTFESLRPSSAVTRERASPGAPPARGRLPSTIVPLTPAAAATGEDEQAASAEAPVIPAQAPARSLAEEVGLLGAARSDLDQGRPEAALRRLDEHARRFPSGALTEERLALRVFALCALGRIEAARAAAGEVVRSAPDSPHLAGIRASCVGAQFDR